MLYTGAMSAWHKRVFELPQWVLLMEKCPATVLGACIHLQWNRFVQHILKDNSFRLMSIFFNLLRLKPPPMVFHVLGGHLALFAHNLGKITMDCWVLEIIHHEYALEFLSCPHQPFLSPAPVAPSQQCILQQEADFLLVKGAIEQIPPPYLGRGFCSPYFLIPKGRNTALFLTFDY